MFADEKDLSIRKYTVDQRNNAVVNFKTLPSPVPLNYATIRYLNYHNLAKTEPSNMHAQLTENWIFNYKNLRLTAFGYHLLQNCSDSVGAYIGSNPEPVLTIGREFPDRRPVFKIVKKLSKRTYQVVHLASGRFYFGKTNHTSRDGKTLAIEKDWFVNLFHREFFEHHRSHICHFKSIYYLPDIECRIFLRPLMDNLQDLITSCILLGRSSAMMLALETFEAIHDLHMHGILHRDIRPCNFLVGRGKDYKSVYVINFGASCATDPRYPHFYKDSNKINPNAETPLNVKKTRYFNWRFTCRNYHLFKPFNKMCDIESWLYMVLYFFHRDFVPWFNKHPNCFDVKAKPCEPGVEIEVFNMKNRFFAGGYDDLYTSMGGFIRGMRGWIDFNYTKYVHTDIIDYPYGIFLLTELHQELNITDVHDALDWIGVNDNTPNKVVIARDDEERKKIIAAKTSVKETIQEKKNLSFTLSKSRSISESNSKQSDDSAKTAHLPSKIINVNVKN